MSDLGFPARENNVSQSTIFRGTFRFSRESPYLFYSNIPGVMLRTNVIFKSGLNIQSLSIGKVK